MEKEGINKGILVEQEVKSDKQTRLINNYKTLNDYYKDFGYNSTALESLYKNARKDSLKFFAKYIDVIQAENSNPIFKIKKAILPSDRKAYNYFTKWAFKALESSKIEAIKNSHTKGIFFGYTTLYNFYGKYGFDHEDLKTAYSYLNANAITFLQKFINVKETQTGDLILTIKEDIYPKTGEDINFFNKRLLKLLAICRLALGKKLDETKIPPNAIDKSRNYYIMQEIRINHSKNLNEFYRIFGIPDEMIDKKFEGTTKTGKALFNEYVDVVIEKTTGKQIYNLKKPITRDDYKAFNYFTKTLIVNILKDMKNNPNSQLVDANEQKDKICIGDFKALINDYITSLKASKIITKELILGLNLPKRYENLLIAEFVVNKSNIFSIDEEAEFLNTTS